MRGKPRGYYGPTGERHSGIRYVPPKEQKMVNQWQEQQDRIAALEAERDGLQFRTIAFAGQLQAWGYDDTANQLLREILRGPVKAPDYYQLRVERDEALAALHTRNGELMVERMNLDMLRDDVKRAIALLPADPGAALGVLILAIHTQSAPQASPAGAHEAIEA